MCQEYPKTTGGSRFKSDCGGFKDGVPLRTISISKKTNPAKGRLLVIASLGAHFMHSTSVYPGEATAVTCEARNQKQRIFQLICSVYVAIDESNRCEERMQTMQLMR